MPRGRPSTSQHTHYPERKNPGSRNCCKILVAPANAMHLSRCYVKYVEYFGVYLKNVKMLFSGRYSNLKMDLGEASSSLRDKGSKPKYAPCLTKRFHKFPFNNNKHWVCCKSIKPWSGFPLCRTSWLRFLGIGKQRWDRTKKRFRGVDDRTLPRYAVNNLLTLSFLFLGGVRVNDDDSK